MMTRQYRRCEPKGKQSHGFRLCRRDGFAPLKRSLRGAKRRGNLFDNAPTLRLLRVLGTLAKTMFSTEQDGFASPATIPGQLLLLLAAVVLLAACSNDPKEKGFEVFPDMVHSVSFQPYSKNPLTVDGKTMLSPPRGTIARGTEPYPYGSTDEDRARASRELKNPVPVSAESLARGKEVYQQMCLVCHGVAGQGDGPIIPKFPNPPSFTTKRVKALTEGALYHVITRGSGLMPSHALQILPQDRWNLVHYIHGLRGVSTNE